MKTKYFILLLALPLLFAGCSKDNDDPGTGGGNTWKVKYEIVPVNPSDTNIQGHGHYFSTPRKGYVRYNYLNGEVLLEGPTNRPFPDDIDLYEGRSELISFPWSVEVEVGDGFFPHLALTLGSKAEPGVYMRVYLDGELYKEIEVNHAEQIFCIELIGVKQ